MIRGTTPTIEIELPFDPAELAVAYLTMRQNGENVIEKTLDDFSVNEKLLSYRLSQEETLNFKIFEVIEVQLRVKTKSGIALATDIERIDPERILKDGVI